MRSYRLFNKPTKVTEVLKEDLNTDISSNWQEKVVRLQHRRWHKPRRIHARGRLFERRASMRRRDAWRRGFGRLMGT